MDRNRGIGKNNQLPWRLSTDMRRFKHLTMGHHIVMGRKTFETIGKPLPGRTTIILTRQPCSVDNCLIAHSFSEAIEIAKARGETELFVCGGGEVYSEALPVADRLYLTEVNAVVEADTFFPPLADVEWVEASSENVEAGGTNQYAFTFRHLERHHRTSSSE
jgi:dihydrofolate reductase